MKNDLVVCAILSADRTAFLLKNYKNVERPSETEPKFAASNKSYWFPFKSIIGTLSLHAEIEQFLGELDSEIDSTKPTKLSAITLLRIQSNHLLPTPGELHKHLKIHYFLCQVSSSTPQLQTSPLVDDPELAWMTLSQMKQAQRAYKLMGMEPVWFFKKFVDLPTEPSFQPNSIDTLFYQPKLSVYMPGSALTENSSEHVLLSAAKFNTQLHESLFRLYFRYAFPSEYLNIVRFRALLNKLYKIQKLMQSSVTSAASVSSVAGLTTRFDSYFHAFDTQHRCVLTFGEVLLGLAAMEPFTQHGGAPAEHRCRYIYRYYTFAEHDTVANMNFEQFKVLISDISQLKKSDASSSQLEADALVGYRSFGLKSTADSLSLSDFLVGVGQLKFRGTSVLFRLGKSLSDILAHPMVVSEAARLG